jgi:uncharacterized protein (TIGR00369 family)
MNQKLANPYQSIEGYNCFGCSAKNAFGLAMKFTENDEGLNCEWIPPEHFQGWMGVLHGGIQATLLDEIASWIVFVKLGKSGVTSELKVRYKHPVRMSDKPLTINAKLKEMHRNIAIIDTFLYDHEGKLCAQGECKYFTFSDEAGKSQYFYPGKEAFYEDVDCEADKDE